MAGEGTEAAGVRPFTFRCRRSGNCCSVPGGYVWVTDAECDRMADALRVDRDVFRETRTRTAVDPATGELRLALADGPDGRCALLEGRNHCTVYDARPEHCRSFPFWPSVLESADGFERARALCPGIEPLVPEEDLESALDELERLYAEVDAFVEKAAPVCIVRGVCCRFEEAGHRLYATGLEAQYAARRHPDAPPPEAAGRCPYHVAGRCTAREGRPLGCRTYFCDVRTESVLAEAHEHFLRRIRELERANGIAPRYAEFPALVAELGIGAPEHGSAEASAGSEGDGG